MRLNVTRNELKRRFEVEVGGQTAFLNYRVDSGAMTLTHTEVPSRLEGRGLGTELARTALQYASQSGLKVHPQCPFVASYIQNHPEYQNLVA